jgi:hypothetical protein
MGNVYMIGESGVPEPMDRVLCQSEERELQLLLEMNFDLLPGDQINPDDPRRWLLVKREMPVPDPNTGTDRWSVDLFLVDQDGTPTFVECKRFMDTRSRREVIGQVLEYAANGHHYWTADKIRDFSEETCQVKGIALEQAMQRLQPNIKEPMEDFFGRVQQNLREGQVRMVFFLEESPFELRSVVDFLNKQMERSEVLLVEARQYDSGNMRIVVPTLVGYTEQARLAKRSFTGIASPAGRRWDPVSFFEDARTKLDDAAFQAVEELYKQCATLGFDIGWGRGAITGSFSITERSVCKGSFLTVRTDGTLIMSFGNFYGSELAERAGRRLRDLISERTGIRVQDTSKFPEYRASEWQNKVETVAAILQEILAEFAAKGCSVV